MPWMAGVAAGVLTGMASTYPVELGPAIAIPLWALVGLGLGLWAGRGRRARSGGIGYGLALTAAFLYSRFGGAAHALPAYTLFVLVMSVVGALGGLTTAFLGSRLRGRAR